MQTILYDDIGKEIIQPGNSTLSWFGCETQHTCRCFYAETVTRWLLEGSLSIAGLNYISAMLKMESM